jgi:hypothetical protein
MAAWKKYWPELDDALPVDVLPCSNGEFIPPEPTAQQRAIWRLSMEQCDSAARRLGIPRRRFLRTGAATALCLIAIDTVLGAEAGGFSFGGHQKPKGPCDLDFPGTQLNHRGHPGEFIFDIQTHHVQPTGEWRNADPGLQMFLSFFPQSRCGDDDSLECFSRQHYMKELFLDSATDVSVLSAVPALPGQNPLPTQDAASTVAAVNASAASMRCVMHAFVMPNHGATGAEPAGMRQQLDEMEQAAESYKEILRAWKVYTPRGDVAWAGGWWLDDRVGRAFIERVRKVGDKYGIPKIVCAHKGFAFPGFDQEKAATRDVGVVAKSNRDLTFIVYHSGFDIWTSGRGLGQSTGRYPEGTGEKEISSSQRGILNFIKALRENEWDATRFVPTGLSHGNVPNVYAELGSVWSTFVSMSADERTYMLCNLIKYVGPKRVVWGTDSLWYGSPQPFIVAFRNFQMNPKIAGDFYNLPYGLDGDADDPTKNALSAGTYMSPNPPVKDWPTDKSAHPERSIRNAIFGRNAAIPYRVDPNTALKTLSCDKFEPLRQAYREAPTPSLAKYGPRTRRQLLAMLRADPWWRAGSS